MLVISRKKGEWVKVGDIWFGIAEMRGTSTRLAIEAPPEVVIVRQELTDELPPVLKSSSKR